LQLPILAQTQPSDVPSAIFGDPPRDAANPTRNEAVWIPSGGVLMNGVMYAAAGSGNHPTVLNLHGTPATNKTWTSRKPSAAPDTTCSLFITAVHGVVREGSRKLAVSTTEFPRLLSCKIRRRCQVSH